MPADEQERVEQEQEAPRGVRCPDCGCADLRVYYTRPLDGGRIRRVRICRNCARKVTTTEKIA